MMFYILRLAYRCWLQGLGLVACKGGVKRKGRTPLEWYIDRDKIKRDEKSGIVNDPNGWFADPRDLITAIKRIVHVSVESTRIIEGLPKEIMDGAEGVSSL